MFDLVKKMFGRPEMPLENISDDIQESVADEISEKDLIESTDSQVSDIMTEYPDYLLHDPRIVGWLSTQEQELLFSILLTHKLHTHSILDVGCGRGDLYNQLNSDELDSYTGIDLDVNKINIGKVKFPETRLIHEDVLNMEQSFDWVVGSGLFNLFDHPSLPLQVEYTQKVIRKMYDLCQVGVAFNLLTGIPDTLTEEERNQLVLHTPGEWFEYLIQTYEKVSCRADYLTGDVTFFLFK
jgi:SAM-dependent methyltransferase